jgi:hypothetical protein
MRKREEDLDLGLLGRVHELYRTALADTPRAREWLGRHGGDDARLLDRFALGFAPGTLKTILSRDPAVRHSLRTLGLLAGPGRGRETLAGCVTVPHMDTTGRVVELVGYAIDGGGPPRRAGMAGGIWNWAAMKAHAEVRLFDDPLKAIAEVSRGDEAVIAIVGDEWTDLTETTFRELAPHRVIVENPRRRKAVAEGLKRLGIGTGDSEPQAPGTEEGPIENGFAARFGRRRYIVQAVTLKEGCRKPPERPPEVLYFRNVPRTLPKRDAGNRLSVLPRFSIPATSHSPF